MPQNSINQIYCYGQKKETLLNSWLNIYTEMKMPWLFEEPNADYLTYRIYIQKAEDNDTKGKEKILAVLEKI